MTLSRRIMLLLTLALWWPATIHCGIEAVSESNWLDCGSSGADACDQGYCEDDGCALIEGGHYRPTYEVFDVGPPVSWMCEYLVCESMLPPPRIEVVLPVDPERTAAPLWEHEWQFELRTAPSPRAPSLIA